MAVAWAKTSDKYRKQHLLLCKLPDSYDKRFSNNKVDIKIDFCAKREKLKFSFCILERNSLLPNFLLVIGNVVDYTSTYGPCMNILCLQILRL